jgi:hypothetical protein
MFKKQFIVSGSLKKQFIASLLLKKTVDSLCTFKKKQFIASVPLNIYIYQFTSKQEKYSSYSIKNIQELYK